MLTLVGLVRTVATRERSSIATLVPLVPDQMFLVFVGFVAQGTFELVLWKGEQIGKICGRKKRLEFCRQP